MKFYWIGPGAKTWEKVPLSVRLYVVKLAQHIFWKCVKKIPFLVNQANFQPWSYHFGTRTPLILWNFIELAQVQKPERKLPPPVWLCMCMEELVRCLGELYPRMEVTSWLHLFMYASILNLHRYFPQTVNIVRVSTVLNMKYAMTSLPFSKSDKV